MRRKESKGNTTKVFLLHVQLIRMSYHQTTSILNSDHHIWGCSSPLFSSFFIAIWIKMHTILCRHSTKSTLQFHSFFTKRGQLLSISMLPFFSFTTINLSQSPNSFGNYIIETQFQLFVSNSELKKPKTALSLTHFSLL